MQDADGPTRPHDDEALTPIVLPADGSQVLPGDRGTPAGGDGGGAEASTVTGARVDAILDRIMSVHRPAVLAHLRAIRSRHPQASPEMVLRILERGTSPR